MICYPTSPNQCRCTTQWRSQKLCVRDRPERRRREGRGAKWGEVWGVVSPPQPTRGVESVVSSPVGSGAKPRPKTRFLHSLCYRTLLVERKQVLS